MTRFIIEILCNDDAEIPMPSFPNGRVKLGSIEKLFIPLYKFSIGLNTHILQSYNANNKATFYLFIYLFLKRVIYRD